MWHGSGWAGVTTRIALLHSFQPPWRLQGKVLLWNVYLCCCFETSMSGACVVVGAMTSSRRGGGESVLIRELMESDAHHNISSYLQYLPLTCLDDQSAQESIRRVRKT